MRFKVIIFVILLTASFLSEAKGGRGGGGRGGGGRGSSSRGSSSRGSSSRGTSTQQNRGTTYERKSSKSEGENSPPYPRQPEFKSPEVVRPSAPKASDIEPYPKQRYHPTNNQQQQPPYNPYYKPPDQSPSIPGRSPGQPAGPPPPYPGGNIGPPAGAPPAYPGGNVRPPGVPPASPGQGANLPPYPGPQQRPPPYNFNERYGAPQQPSINRPYPQQPSFNNRPYPQQPGMGHGVSTNFQQPPPPGFINNNRSPFYQPSYGGYAGGVGASASNMYAKPQKQKGFIGQLMSMGKTPKHHGFGGSSYGSPFGMKHGSKALYPMMPLMMMKKPSLFSSPFRSPFIFMPIPFGFHGYHHGYHHGYNSRYSQYDSDDYRGACRQPLVPKFGSLNCNATELGVKCRAVCNVGYKFSDDIDFKENECWHVGGVWRPTRNFEACQPSCVDECLNGGKCSKPGVCTCAPLYRGEKCQYYVLNCDFLKFAGDDSRQFSWTCEHGKNETVCKVKCRTTTELPYEDPLDITTVTCSPEGNWTSSSLPNCDKDKNDLNGNLTTLVPPER